MSKDKIENIRKIKNIKKIIKIQEQQLEDSLNILKKLELKFK